MGQEAAYRAQALGAVRRRTRRLSLATTDRSLSPLVPVETDHDRIIALADSRSMLFGDGSARQVLTLSVDTLASVLGVSPRSMRRWIVEGQFPFPIAVEERTRAPRFTVSEATIYARLFEARVLAHRHVDARRVFDPEISPSGDLYAARIAIARRLRGVR